MSEERALYICQKCGEELDGGDMDRNGLHAYCGGEMDPNGTVSAQDEDEEGADEQILDALRLREENAALRAEVAKLRGMVPYVEDSGHYCDGMSDAWQDAQGAISRQVAAEPERDALREQICALANVVVRLNNIDVDEWHNDFKGTSGVDCYCPDCGTPMGGSDPPQHTEECSIGAAVRLACSIRQGDNGNV